jgi:hypothetical protein
MFSATCGTTEVVLFQSNGSFYTGSKRLLVSFPVSDTFEVIGAVCQFPTYCYDGNGTRIASFPIGNHAGINPGK